LSDNDNVFVDYAASRDRFKPRQSVQIARERGTSQNATVLHIMHGGEVLVRLDDGHLDVVEPEDISCND
jgi:hypothetical protein